MQRVADLLLVPKAGCRGRHLLLAGHRLRLRPDETVARKPRTHTATTPMKHCSNSPPRCGVSGGRGHAPTSPTPPVATTAKATPFKRRRQPRAHTPRLQLQQTRLQPAGFRIPVAEFLGHDVANLLQRHLAQCEGGPRLQAPDGVVWRGCGASPAVVPISRGGTGQQLLLVAESAQQVLHVHQLLRQRVLRRRRGRRLSHDERAEEIKWYGVACSRRHLPVH